MSQSPSLRGSGRFAALAAWRRAAVAGLNPLHCGAVVASGRRGTRLLVLAFSLNPLHCGAVVASKAAGGAGRGGYYVSIPFIAGQWSLPAALLTAVLVQPHVSIPFIAGQWSLLHAWTTDEDLLVGVSIPFIAGQWSLPTAHRAGGPVPPGLNPLHCGAVVASRCAWSRWTRRPRVSIPFIAGQWSLRRDAERRAGEGTGLNPLHCGAVVASGRRGGNPPAEMRVSNPVIAGQWSLRPPGVSPPASPIRSQSPSLRGSGRFLPPLMWLKGGGFAGRLSTVSVPPNARADPSVS